MTKTILSRIELIDGLQNHETYVCKTLGGGDCWYHCISMILNENYRNMDYEDKIRESKKRRKELASSLEMKYDESISFYEKLGEGMVKEMSIYDKKFSLEALKYHIKNSNYADDICVELTSIFYDLDIYMINKKVGDIYNMPGIPSGLKKSIIIAYDGCHYENLVEKIEGIYVMIFRPDDDIITSIRKRIFSMKSLDNQCNKVEICEKNI